MSVRVHPFACLPVVLLAVALAGCEGPPGSRDIPEAAFDDVSLPTEGATGWTEGAWSVNDDGSSSYTVPLWVPPGRNGMQPGLALSYNSRAGEGLAGFGWSLAGLSSIATCARTPLNDGEYEVQPHAEDDPLCLDGARLEGVKIGTLGGGDYRVFRNGRVRVDRLDAGFACSTPTDGSSPMASRKTPSFAPRSRHARQMGQSRQCVR